MSRKSPRYDGSKDASMDSNLRRNTNSGDPRLGKVENVKIIGAARNASFGKSQNTSKMSDDSLSFTNRAFND